MIARSAGRFAADDGLEIAYERWGGAPPSILFVHANGFCKEVWRPVVDELGRLGVAGAGLAIDQRGHGDSQRSAPPVRWVQLGKDAGVAASLLTAPRIGVGHSSGGAALCRAEAATPGLFAALVLIEPIIFPPPFTRGEQLPIVEIARRRRTSFASRAVALARYRHERSFGAWRADALEAYVSHGFEEHGGRWALKCAPETEADVFAEGTNHDTWDLLPSIQCPVVLVAGTRSNTHPADTLEALERRIPDAGSVLVAEASHFVPMERPDAVASAVAAAVGTITS